MTPMLKLILRRVLWSIPVLLAILIIVFSLMHAMPGGPWDNEGGGPRALSNLGMNDNIKQSLIRRFGLNEPLWKQFTAYVIGRTPPSGEFICGLICGNMGPSYQAGGRPVNDILLGPPSRGKTILESRFVYSLRLAGYAFLAAVLVGLPLGIIAALRQDTWVDYTIKTVATLLISLPNFVIGLLMIIVLGGQLHLITISPTNWAEFVPRTWFTPIFILSIGTLAPLIRITRSSILEVLHRDYVRTARGKGAPEPRVLILHILKNALIPIITFSGPALLELFAGTFVVEAMFGYPGMGREFVDAAVSRDYSMIMGSVLIYAVIIVGANILVDVLYGMVDPRTRMMQGEA